MPSLSRLAPVLNAPRSGFVLNEALNVALDVIPHSIFILDSDGRYVFQNAHDRASFGELCGLTAREAAKDEASSCVWDRAHRSALGGESVHYVHDRQTAIGRNRAEVFLRPLRIEGLVVGAVGLSIDQTRLMNAQDGLREANSRLKAFLDSSSDWLWEQDAELRFVPGTRVSSPDAPTPDGLTRWDYVGVDPDRDPRWAAHKADLLARRPFDQFVYLVKGRDGRPLWLEISGRPIFDEAGNFQGYRGVGRDVTERQELVERLKQAELVVQNTRNAIVICDASGLVRWVNPACERLTGYALAEMQGCKPGSLLQCADTDPSTVARISAALARQEAVRVEILNADRSGRRYWIDMDIQPVVDERGRLDGFIAVETDITETVLLRQHLKAVFDNVPSCIAVFDEEGALVDCNHTVEKVTGWTLAEMRGMRCDAFRWAVYSEAGPPYAEQEHPVYVALREERRVEALVGFSKLGSDEVQWLKGSIQPITGPHGGRLAIFGFADVTEELAAKARLSDALARAERALSELGAYRSALDQSSLVAVYDRGGRLTYANDLFRRTCGYDRSELLGQLIGPLIDSDQQPPEFYHSLRETVRAGRMWRGEVCNRAKDGRLYWVEETIVPQRDEQGQVVAAVSISTDISDRKRAERARQDSEARYRLLADNSSDVIILGDRKGRRSYFSPAIERMAGYTPEEALTVPMEDWVHPDDIAEVFRTTATLSPERPSVSAPYRLRRKDGSYLWVEAAFTLAHDADGAPHIVATIRDVSRRKAIETEYRNLFERAAVDIYRRTLDFRLVRANPALARSRGYATESEFLERESDNQGRWRMDANHRRRRAETMDQDGGLRNFVSEIVNRETGERRFISETAWIVHDESGQPVYIDGMALDVTEQLAAQESLRMAARRDSLTGLPNRLAFLEAANAAVAALRREAVEPQCARLLFIDLDQFKAVNDRHGHRAGDDLLGQVAERLRAVVGERGLPARLGGDEFAVLLAEDAGRTEAEGLAVRIIAALNHPIALAGGQIAAIGASIGLAAFDPAETTSDLALQRADTAMYAAKQAGRNAYRTYAPTLLDDRKAREALKYQLRTALHDGQISLAYQPIVAIEDGERVGYEALARWSHPELGQVSPSTFIPLAEAGGLIVELGERLLGLALAQLAQLPDPMRLNVNVSTLQLRDTGFAEFVLMTLARRRLAPSRLEIEVTETVLLDDCPLALANLARLQSAGVRVALDDFGTGWSSLSYLTRHRFDRIKIDRSFVQSFADPRTQAVLNGIAGIAWGLGARLTAEGIETREQWQAMRALGCDEGQGYLFGRPALAEAIADVAPVTLASRAKKRA